MRPVRLELKGFSAFREPTVIDFDRVDLAAIIGPTGAGKSTVLDAVGFALYGSVARYDHLGAIAPAIHQLATEARVRLDFTIGTEQYVAVRVIRRQPRGTGATTREVRLERVRGDANEVLAANAAEMSDAVQAVVGLTFEQFNKTVILPQGEFAAFLHQKGADRQTMLRTLLDLGVYQRMGRDAGERRTEAHALGEATAERIAGLPGPDRISEAEERHGTFVDLAKVLAEHLDVVRDAEAELDVLRERILALDLVSAGLRAIVVPDGIAALDARRVEASEALAGFRSARVALDAEQAQLTERLGELPSPEALRDAADAHRSLARLTLEAETLTDAVAGAEGVEAAADQGAGSAGEAARDARRRWEQLDRAAGVGALRSALVVGHACPVCERPVEHLPEHDLDEELAAARVAMESAEATAEEARAALQQASARTLAARGELEANGNRLAEVRARVEVFPELAAITSALDEADSIVVRQRELNRARPGLADDERGAEEALRALEKREVDARRDLVIARDAVAQRHPPLPAAESLLTDWTDLAAWAGAELEVVTADRSAAETESGARRQEVDAALRAVHDACERAGVDPTGLELARLQRKVDATVVKVETELEQLRTAESERAGLVARAAELERTEATAAALSRHLSATGFERWLLASILNDLVVRAGERLLGLSSQRYDLHLTDDAEFEIVDRHNGDERRSVRTLSGGETFLASLALALALADDIADLAAAGAPRLDSVFLDEGFGTLDAETLETVADAIDELGASGRMVCIVTHIRELAERMPVRFEVTAGPVSSSVERVEP